VEPEGRLATGVELRPIEASAFPGFVARARDVYRRQMIDFGYFDAAEARAKAETDTARLFPGDRPTKDVHAFDVVNEDTNDAAGIVFFASVPRGDETIAFVYGIEIDDRFRGRGFGRATMLAVEAKARELGHVEVRLNVFGGNEAARGLYRSLGYEDVDVTMMKPLT
jgi:ribosomal protein S18 acetylase RimI-like enzyme